MILEDRVSVGGARIIVNDEAMDNSTENKERVSLHLSQIASRIVIEDERSAKEMM